VPPQPDPQRFKLADRGEARKGGDDRCVHRPHRRPDDEVGADAGFEERPQHAHLVRAEVGAAAQHEGGLEAAAPVRAHGPLVLGAALGQLGIVLFEPLAHRAPPPPGQALGVAEARLVPGLALAGAFLVAFC